MGAPPTGGARLRENLDLLLHYSFVSSTGVRYPPWFGPEMLLVETFAETELGLPSPLLAAVRLPRRHGLSRGVIEDALRTHRGRVCTEIGVDPLEYGLVCIPFDAYLRLAPHHDRGRGSWGRISTATV